MCGIFKTVLRTGLIVGLVGVLGLGGLALVAGKERAAAVIEQTRTSIAERIDRAVDDPTALRAQLRELQSQYPERIAQVRGDLGQIQDEIRQLERERAISERVVDMTSADIAMLRPVVSEAQTASFTGTTAATVRFQDRILTVTQAQTRLTEIQNTNIAYTNRAVDAAQDLTRLQQQADRLAQVLAQLETERAQFETQLAQLDRQVDAIARNERLIELMKKRQQTIEECGRYRAESLDQVVTKLSTLQSRQEAELDFLASDQQRVSYEDMARVQIDASRADQTGHDSSVRLLPAPQADQASQR